MISPERGLNPRLPVYETGTLPLSYRGINAAILMLQKNKYISFGYYISKSVTLFTDANYFKPSRRNTI